MSSFTARRPRVAIVSHTYLEGYREKLDYLSRRVDLRLITPVQFTSAFGRVTANDLRQSGYRVTAYQPVYPVGVQTSTRWALRSRDFGFRQWAPDVIHVENELHSFILLQALLYRQLHAPRARVVVSTWGNLPLIGWRRLLGVGEQWCLPRVNMLIAGSRDAAVLLARRGVPVSRLTVFPQVGVDVERYRPVPPEVRQGLRAELGLPVDAFLVGYVGRFVAEKGLEDLLAACGQVSTQVPEARLICVGTGPLADHMRAAGPAVTVVSPGMGARIVPYFQALDVLVLPSRTTPLWKEQFGRVLIEAMACGVPVVGSDSGAVPEVIGEAGLIFPERQAPALSAQLLRLYRDPDLRTRFSQAGRFRVVNEYAHERIAEKTLAIYSRALGTRNGALLLHGAR